MATYLTINGIRVRVKGGELPLFRPDEVVSLDEKKARVLIKAGNCDHRDCSEIFDDTRWGATITADSYWMRQGKH